MHSDTTPHSIQIHLRERHITNRSVKNIIKIGIALIAEFERQGERAISEQPQSLAKSYRRICKANRRGMAREITECKTIFRIIAKLNASGIGLKSNLSPLIRGFDNTIPRGQVLDRSGRVYSKHDGLNEVN